MVKYPYCELFLSIAPTHHDKDFKFSTYLPYPCNSIHFLEYLTNFRYFFWCVFVIIIPNKCLLLFCNHTINVDFFNSFCILPTLLDRLTIVTNFSTFWVQLRSDVVSRSEGNAPTTEHLTQKSSSHKPDNLFTTPRYDTSKYSKSNRSTGGANTSRTSEKATTTQQILVTDDPKDPDDSRTLFSSTETVRTTPLTTPFTFDPLFSSTEVVPLSSEELSSRNPLSTGRSSTHPGQYQDSDSSTLATTDTNAADKTDVSNTDFVTTSPYDSTDGETPSSTEEFKVDIKTGFLSTTPLKLIKEHTTTERDGLKNQPPATFYLFSSLPTDKTFTNTESRFPSVGDLFSSSEVAPLSSGEVTSRNPMSTERFSTYPEPQEYADQSTLATDHTKVTDETDFLTLFENTDFISAGHYNSTDGETSITTDEFITDIQTDFLPTILFDLSTETGESTTTEEDGPNKPSATFLLLSSLPSETTTFQNTERSSASTADILTSVTQSDEKISSVGVTSQPVMSTLPEGIRTTTMEDDYDDDDDTTSAIMTQLSTEVRNTATATDFRDFSKTTNLFTSLPTLTFQDENEFTSLPVTTQRDLSTPQLSTEQIHTTREKTHSTQTVNFFTSLKTNARTTEFIPNESNGMTTTEAAMITTPTGTASRTSFSMTTETDMLTTFGRKSTTLLSTSTLRTVPEEEMMTSDEDFYDYTTDEIIATTDEVLTENSTDLNNGTTIITTTKPTTTRVPTTVQLTTTGISTTSPLSTTEFSTTSPLRTTETSTTNQLTTTEPLTTNQLTTTGALTTPQLTTTGALTTNQLTSTGPLTTTQLTTTGLLTTTQLTTTGALTTQLTTTEIFRTSPLTPTELSTTTQETTTVLSTTVQPTTTVMSKTPQVTTVGSTSRAQYNTTALSSTFLSTTPAPNGTSATTAVSSSASPETNTTTIRPTTTSIQSSSRPNTTASTSSTSKGVTSNTPSTPSSTSSSTTRPNTPQNGN